MVYMYVRRCVYIYIYTHTHTHIYIHACIYTMEYYSDTKNNAIMPFAAMWMNLEIILIVKKERER